MKMGSKAGKKSDDALPGRVLVTMVDGNPIRREDIIRRGFDDRLNAECVYVIGDNGEEYKVPIDDIDGMPNLIIEGKRNRNAFDTGEWWAEYDGSMWRFSDIDGYGRIQSSAIPHNDGIVTWGIYSPGTDDEIDGGFCNSIEEGMALCDKAINGLTGNRAASRRMNRKADFWNPSPVAEQLMDIDNAVWDMYGWNSGNDVRANWYVYLMEIEYRIELAGITPSQITDEVIDDLVDSNYHSLCQALSAIGIYRHAKASKRAMKNRTIRKTSGWAAPSINVYEYTDEEVERMKNNGWRDAKSGDGT